VTLCFVTPPRVQVLTVTLVLTVQVSSIQSDVNSGHLCASSRVTLLLIVQVSSIHINVI
jgi:hypothetical protein